MKFLFLLLLGLKFLDSANAQTGRALIIAIENYPASGGWHAFRITTLNDINLIQQALQKQNFLPENINVLKDSMATKKGIREAMEKLVAASKPGDKIVIHISAHGEQIEDDNVDEEADGLDESIVPYDAIYSEDIKAFDTISVTYYRDDEFGNAVTRLRNVLGKNGDVLVIIDACHSATGTRGQKAGVRGGRPPLVSGRISPKKFALKDTAGVFKESKEVLNADAAGYIVISAAQAQELNSETSDEDGNIVGSLSFAINKTLNNLNGPLSYRSLFARVENILREKVPEQRPAIEGDNIDRLLFGGKVQMQTPYILSKMDSRNKKLMELQGGTVSGITKGSTILFFKAGSVSNPSGKTPLATGIVENAKYFTSTVRLNKEIPGAGNKFYWGFVKELKYGTEKVKLGIDSLNTAEATKIRNGLRNFPAAEITAKPDLYFGKSDDGAGWSLRYPGSGSVFEKNISPDSINKLKEVLKRFDRHRYLKNLSFNMDGLSAEVKLVLLDSDLKPDWEKTKQRTVLGRLEVKEGDFIRPIIVNTGEKNFYVNIVDLQPDGKINAIIPNAEKKISTDECRAEPGDTLQITNRGDFFIEIGPPFGEEVFKIFLYENELNLEEMLTSTPSQIASRGNSLSQLEKIFQGPDVNAMGSRGTTTINKDKDGTIFNINFRIVPL